MTDLATLDDLEARLGSPINENDQLRMSALLQDASATVRDYCGQTFTLVEDETIRLSVKRRMVKLPQRPVVDVSAVQDVNGNDVLFTWENGDRLEVAHNLDAWSFEQWAGGIKWVDVTYTHGSDPVPDQIIAVVCSVALRAFGREATDSGVTQETIGSYSYGYGSTAGAGPLGLLQDERRVLDRYRRQASSVTVSPA